jgi:hypothetical protein
MIKSVHLTGGTTHTVETFWNATAVAFFKAPAGPASICWKPVAGAPELYLLSVDVSGNLYPEGRRGNDE